MITTTARCHYSSGSFVGRRRSRWSSRDNRVENTRRVIRAPAIKISWTSTSDYECNQAPSSLICSARRLILIHKQAAMSDADKKREEAASRRHARLDNAGILHMSAETKMDKVTIVSRASLRLLLGAVKDGRTTGREGASWSTIAAGDCVLELVEVQLCRYLPHLRPSLPSAVRNASSDDKIVS